MKKLSIMAVLAAIAMPAFAEPPAMPDGEHGPRMGHEMMQNLTDEQKSCLADKGCVMPEFTEGETPDHDAMDTARECMKNAAAECGIEMPEPPAKPAGDMTEPPAKPDVEAAETPAEPDDTSVAEPSAEPE